MKRNFIQLVRFEYKKEQGLLRNKKSFNFNTKDNYINKKTVNVDTSENRDRGGSATGLNSLNLQKHCCHYSELIHQFQTSSPRAEIKIHLQRTKYSPVPIAYQILSYMQNKIPKPPTTYMKELLIHLKRINVNLTPRLNLTNNASI